MTKLQNAKRKHNFMHLKIQWDKTCACLQHMFTASPHQWAWSDNHCLSHNAHKLRHVTSITMLMLTGQNSCLKWTTQYRCGAATVWCVCPTLASRQAKKGSFNTLSRMEWTEISFWLHDRKIDPKVNSCIVLFQHYTSAVMPLLTVYLSVCSAMIITIE